VPEAKSGGEYKLWCHAFLEYPFKVSARSPTGDARRILVALSGEDATVWLGEVTPDASGPWSLRLESLRAADPACYEDVAPLGVLLELPGESRSRSRFFVTVAV
jgi:hypothetical protein